MNEHFYIYWNQAVKFVSMKIQDYTPYNIVLTLIIFLYLDTQDLIIFHQLPHLIQWRMARKRKNQTVAEEDNENNENAVKAVKFSVEERRNAFFCTYR